MSVCGCFSPLLNGDALEKDVAELLVLEAPAAAKVGLVAALVVALVLSGLGGGVSVVAPRVFGAFALAVVLHGAVLLAGTAVVRGLEKAGVSTT
ncbi:hypothetical protein VB773_10185 [Haloarculaceae archaeon H-GB2-1]|nr:hypothetical protein [Haloarculaceae archaeon H-GB1-1]MEA5386382.1 hypothetical protein [Haloarculaceae archaeon H-GB11]MEA5407890.1 hypothetical protein [Haloarculaceae archaeon H-GB2-1]